MRKSVAPNPKLSQGTLKVQFISREIDEDGAKDGVVIGQVTYIVMEQLWQSKLKLTSVTVYLMLLLQDAVVQMFSIAIRLVIMSLLTMRDSHSRVE